MARRTHSEGTNRRGAGRRPAPLPGAALPRTGQVSPFSLAVRKLSRVRRSEPASDTDHETGTSAAEALNGSAAAGVAGRSRQRRNGATPPPLADTLLTDDLLDEVEVAPDEDAEASASDDADDETLLAAGTGDDLDLEIDDDDDVLAVAPIVAEDDDEAVELTVGLPGDETNVDSLLARLDAEPRRESRSDAPVSARRRLEEYLERKRIARELEDLEDFEV